MMMRRSRRLKPHPEHSFLDALNNLRFSLSHFPTTPAHTVTRGLTRFQGNVAPPIGGCPLVSGGDRLRRPRRCLSRFGGYTRLRLWGLPPFPLAAVPLGSATVEDASEGGQSPARGEPEGRQSPSEKYPQRRDGGDRRAENVTEAMA